MVILYFLLILCLSRVSAQLNVWNWWPPLCSPPHFTGEYSPPLVHLDKTRITGQHILNLFGEKSPSKLAYGNVMNDIQSIDVESDVVKSIRHFLRLTFPNIGRWSVHKVRKFELKGAANHGQDQLLATYRYQSCNREILEFQYAVTFGINYYIEFRDEQAVVHRLALGYDKENQFNLFQHTTEPQDFCEGSQCPEKQSKLRVLTYNIWNVNPPDHAYGRHNRYTQYQKRINLFVEYLTEANAGIIGIQELRYDSTFGPVGQHAQIQHILDKLPPGHKYEFVYQSAMTYFNSRDPLERIEEGPAILSKFPIVSSDYMLLSRRVDDPNDVHQRICLHAVINVPGWGHVDVYVTHLSLSEMSREKTMVEIWDYMKQGQGKTQVLLGDLNAEPQSRGIRFLQGLEELHGAQTDLVDAWLEVNPEPVPRSTETIDMYERFTFPADRPEKRIDYLLYRGKGFVHECKVVGQHPTPDTAHFPATKGMLDPDSPVWASDHRGVVMELHQKAK